jgi:D-alanine-D-alanine ligase
MLGLPHSSAAFDKMALTFNKMYTLSTVKAYGIPVAPSLFYRRTDRIDRQRIMEEIGYPLIVKPNRAGSSYGISKVKRPAELEEALRVAFAEDNEILIEKFIQGREFSIGVIRLNGDIEVFPITEIIPEGAFFDYEAKYLGKARELTPAPLEAREQQILQQTAARVYEVLDLDGVSRAEYILHNGVPYFLEINMVPGLTEASILPQQIRAAGKTLAQVFDEIIENALHKVSHREK